MTIPPKKVTNADAGDADHVGGNDWDDLADYLNDVDKTGPVKINTATQYRTGKFKLRDSGNTHNYIFATGDVAADRTVTYPVLTGNDIPAFEAHTQTLTNKTIDIETNPLILRENTYLIFKDGSTYYARHGTTGALTSNSSFDILIQAIIDAIPTRDETVFTKIKIGPGSFVVDDTISILDKYNLHIEGSGEGITRLDGGSGLTGDQKVWDIEGSVSGTSKNLTANTTLKGYQATMSTVNAATFSVGDTILLRSTALWYASGIGKKGEIKQIEAIDGGTGVIDFSESIYDVYLTADTASMIKLLPAKNIKFSNLTIGKTSGYTNTEGEWLFFRFVNNVHITNVTVEDSTGDSSKGIILRSCLNSRLSDIHLIQNKANTPNNQYGIALNNCCQNVVVTNCTAIGQFRHSFLSGAYADQTNGEGVCRGTTFHNCTSRGTDSNAYDVHPFADGTTFSNCSIVGSYNIGGFSMRARRSKVIGCYISSHIASPAINVNEDAFETQVIGNTIFQGSDTASVGIEVKDGLDNVMISNNTIEDCTDAGIALNSGSDGCIITNNIIKNNDDSGIWIDNCDKLIISGNLIHNNGDYGINFSAGNCTDNIITSNSFSGNSSGSKANGGQTGCVEANNFGY